MGRELNGAIFQLGMGHFKCSKQNLWEVCCQNLILEINGYHSFNHVDVKRNWGGGSTSIRLVVYPTSSLNHEWIPNGERAFLITKKGSRTLMALEHNYIF